MTRNQLIAAGHIKPAANAPKGPARACNDAIKARRHEAHVESPTVRALAILARAGRAG